MSYHPRVPSLLRLDRWFCKNVRIMIYRKFAVCDVVAVKIAHGMSVRRLEAEEVLRSTHVLELFKRVMLCYMLDGKCTLRFDINAIVRNAIKRNDVEFVRRLHSIGACVCMDDLISPTMEMFEFVCKHAFKGPTNTSVTITSEMLAMLHANGYTSAEISDYGVGMGCTKDEIVKYVGVDGTNVISGIIASKRWGLLMDLWDDRLSNELYSSDIQGIIQYAPAFVFDRIITSQHVYEGSSTHVYAWMHSPERALRVYEYACEYAFNRRIPAYDESHARWIIAQGCVPAHWQISKDATWQLDVGILFTDQWEIFPVAYYDRMHALMPLPREITSYMSFPQARWLYARGVPISKFIFMRVYDCEYTEWLLTHSDAKPDMNFDISMHEPNTVELLCKHGWKPRYQYLNCVGRIDTFRWLLKKFGAYSDIYKLIDNMSPLLYDDVYAVCKPPPYTMWFTRCIDTVQWMHKKGLVWPDKMPVHRINDIGNDFMQKHFGEPYVAAPT